MHSAQCAGCLRCLILRVLISFLCGDSQNCDGSSFLQQSVGSVLGASARPGHAQGAVAAGGHWVCDDMQRPAIPRPPHVAWLCSDTRDLHRLAKHGCLLRHWRAHTRTTGLAQWIQRADLLSRFGKHTEKHNETQTQTRSHIHTYCMFRRAAVTMEQPSWVFSGRSFTSIRTCCAVIAWACNQQQQSQAAQQSQRFNRRLLLTQYFLALALVLTLHTTTSQSTRRCK